MFGKKINPFRMSISIDSSEVEKMLGDLSKKANIVMARASNRAATTAATSLKKEAAARYRIIQKDVAKTIHRKNATKERPYATITSIGKHIGLEYFTVSPFRVLSFKGSKGKKRRNPKIYKAAVYKNQGLKLLNGNPKPFVAVLNNGHIGVFVRKDVSRNNKGKYRRGKRKEKYRNFIKSVQGPAIPQILKNKDIVSATMEATNDTMNKRIKHEVGQILERAQK